MIVLPRSAIKLLCQKGTVDCWSPRETGEPALNIIHVVRSSSRGETFARARPVSIRTATLQRLTYDDALSAGFKTRDDFYSWWRRRYATGPRMDRIRCYVVAYELVVDDIPQFLDRRGYTSDGHRSIDTELTEDLDGRLRELPLEAVTDERYLKLWAKRAEDVRLGRVDDAKRRWRERRRGRNAA